MNRSKSTLGKSASPSESLPHNIRLAQCAKCYKNRAAPEEFTSTWCNDCRKKLNESLSTIKTELQETTATLTKKVEHAEAKIAYLKKFHMSPLNIAFKGDISFYLVGNDHLSCRFCHHKLEGFDPPIQAHRFILCSKSPVFHQMLETQHWNDEWERATGAIEIHGMTPTLLRSLLNYMYVGEIQFSDEVTPLDALKFASKFQIEELKIDASHELVKTLTSDNLKDMMTLANEHNSEVLKIRCKNFFQERF